MFKVFDVFHENSIVHSIRSKASTDVIDFEPVRSFLLFQKITISFSFLLLRFGFPEVLQYVFFCFDNVSDRFISIDLEFVHLYMGSLDKPCFSSQLSNSGNNALIIENRQIEFTEIFFYGLSEFLAVKTAAFLLDLQNQKF